MPLVRSKETSADREHRRELLSTARFEVIPLNNLANQLPHFPSASPVSVTASPAKTLEDTWALSRELFDLGLRPVPHLAARMVTSKKHLQTLLAQLQEFGASELFLVGGDAPEPFGPFTDSLQVLETILELEHGLEHIGVTAYPDGHAFISAGTLSESLRRKQELLVAGKVSGHAATQMCFDPEAIRVWLTDERNTGLTLPVHLGIPGVVERTKLLTVGARLGVGASLRFLKKNRSTLARMFAPGGYDPNKLLIPLASDLKPLKVEGLHICTFNQVENTVEWRQKAVEGLRTERHP